MSSYHTSSSSIEEGAKDAKGQLDSLGTTFPIALGAVGLALVLAGVFIVRQRDDRDAP